MCAAEPAKPADPSYEQRVELEYWTALKDSGDPAVLGTYLERYPKGEFAPIAKALIEHHERQVKVQAAAREEERRRQEEARKEAEVKRLEEERRARETVMAGERKRAEVAKDGSTAKRLDQEQQAELTARTEELRKAVEEARLAREAAKVAEEQRLVAVKAAENATKSAEETIAKKRDTEKSPAKLAALPKMELPVARNPFDGTWVMTWTNGAGCKYPGSFSTTLQIANGVIEGRVRSGSVSGRITASGAATFSYPAITDGAPVRNTGTFSGGAGSGTFARPDRNCVGTFTVKRN